MRKRLRSNRLSLFSLACLVGISLEIAAQPAPDFALTIKPDKLAVIPGKSSAFLVTVSPLNGFTGSVQLAATDLAPGLTNSFSPNPVVLPGTGNAILTLTADESAPIGTSQFNLTGTSGSLTHSTTSGPVTVNFGLIPIGNGTIRGVVRDAETGQPVPGAGISRVWSGYGTKAASDGAYMLTMPLDSGNDWPMSVGLEATDTTGNNTYYPLTQYTYLVRDSTTVLDFDLVPRKYGILEGTVVDTDNNPVYLAKVKYGTGDYEYVTTDTNGVFRHPGIFLGNNNAPVDLAIQALKDGYWGSVPQGRRIGPGTNEPVHLVIMQACFGNITGQIVDADSGAAVAGQTVYLSPDLLGHWLSADSDATGWFVMTNVSLGANNTQITYQLRTYRKDIPVVASASLSQCGQTATSAVFRLPHLNLATLTGHVYDKETKEVITSASLGFSLGFTGYSTESDQSGSYTITNIDLVTLQTSPITLGANLNIGGVSEPYYRAASNLVLKADQVVTQDMYMLRKHYGYAAVTVRDAFTHLPIASARVENGYTDENGQYLVGPRELIQPNAPTKADIFCEANGYFRTYGDTVFMADTTNVVDIDLIPYCDGATVMGTVVDAVTQKPIRGATVNGAITDANGWYSVHMWAGDKNAPVESTLTASAPGYNAQTRKITVFCGATITVDFGRPQTFFGTVEGYVTNAVTGLPLTNIFVGSEFGGASHTDTNGYYKLTQVPLGVNGEDRTWNLTATPPEFAALKKSVLVSSNFTARLDFGFSKEVTDLAVSVAALPDPVDLRGNLTYKITVLNQGGDATNVVLTSVLPPGVTVVSSSVTNTTGAFFGEPSVSDGTVTSSADHFVAGAAMRLVVVVKPTAVGYLTNVVSVTTDTTDTVSENNSARAITSAINTDADLGLTVTLTPNPVVVSNSLTYMIAVTNYGPGDVTRGFLITNPFPANVWVNPGEFTVRDGVLELWINSLKAGKGAQYGVMVRPLTAGSLTLTATATPSQFDPNPANNQASATVTVTGSTPVEADLQVGITAVPEPVTVEGDLTYTLTVKNLGPAPATGVAITNLLPSGVDFVHASGEPQHVEEGLVFRLETLAVGAETSYSVVVRPKNPGSITSRLAAKSDQTDPNLENNTTSVITTVAEVPPVVADLVVAIKPDSDSVAVGSQVSYVLAVTNAGPAAATGVMLTNLLPAEVDFVSATGEYEQTEGGIVFAIGSMELGVGTSFTVVVTTKTPGFITSQLVGKADQTDPNLENNSASVVTTVTQVIPSNADLALLMTATPSPITLGASITYTLTVTNAGPADAPAVQVIDTLPLLAAVTSTDAVQGDVEQNGGELRWHVGNLAGSTSATLTLVVQPSAVGQYTNTATANLLAAPTDDPVLSVSLREGSSGQLVADPNLENNSATIITTVAEVPPVVADLVVAMKPSSDSVAVGGQISYVLAVTNAGPASATGVMLTNLLPAEVDFVSATGEYEETEGGIVFSIGSLQLGAGTSFTVVVTTKTPGTITSRIMVRSDQTDPNLENNAALAMNTVKTQPTSLSVQVTGPLSLNRQTGLFEQTVRVMNETGNAVPPAVQLSIQGLAANMQAHNASGTTPSGTPFVLLNNGLGVGGYAQFLLEFYIPNRQVTAQPSYSAQSIDPVDPAVSAGTRIEVTATQWTGNRLLIAFTSVPGRRYIVEYSSDLSHWKQALPAITAAGTKVQWYDDGPPKTETMPTQADARYYRVIELPNN